MTTEQLLCISPLIVLGVAAVVMLGVLAFYRSHRLTVGLTLAALAGAMVLLVTVVPRGSHPVTALVLVDGQFVFFSGLIFAAAFSCALLAAQYLPSRDVLLKEEFYVLLLLATLGAASLTASVHMASFFLSLEILSVSLYPMIAYERRSALGIEAGTKYLVLAATSSAMLLFGLAIVYAQGGTMSIVELAQKASVADSMLGEGGFLKRFVPMLAGLALILVGVGFKLALVPFHLWTPDVYQASPTPVTAFIATASKGAVFALLLRYANLLDLQANTAMHLILFLVAIASMLGGNLLALLQNNVVRILAYSSIAHMGYLLVALLVGGRVAAQTVAFYMAAYFVTTIGAFGVISLLKSAPGRGTTLDTSEANLYQGLYARKPAMAVILTLMLLSLAGLPLTAGFIGKFLVLRTGMAGQEWVLVIVLIAASGIGLFYYLRVILAMYSHIGQALPSQRPRAQQLAPAGAVVVWIMTGLLLALGIVPEWLLNVIAQLLQNR